MAGDETSSDSFGMEQWMLFAESDVSHIDAFVRRILGAELASFFDEEVVSIPQFADCLLKHDQLDGGYRRFDVSFEIAESWRRLAFDPQNIKSHDITLLNHELMEMRLVSDGSTQDEAHTIASRKYDYAKESAEYYSGMQKKVIHEENYISGAITFLSGNTH